LAHLQSNREIASRLDRVTKFDRCARDRRRRRYGAVRTGGNNLTVFFPPRTTEQKDWRALDRSLGLAGLRSRSSWPFSQEFSRSISRMYSPWFWAASSSVILALSRAIS
jgi:hypothetical protein